MRTKLFLILFLLLPSVCFGAITEGTNAGFVTVAPTDDPAGTNNTKDTNTIACKFVAPASATAITALGWYCDNATEAANFQIGLYAHDAGDNEPGALLVNSGDIAKGTTAGWKSASVSLAITGGITYWIAVQLDNTATATSDNESVNASYKKDFKDTETALVDPWGISDATAGKIMAYYAVYTTGSQVIFIE